MDISWVGMARQHYEPGKSRRIRMVVLHATAGRWPGDFQWLRQGGSQQRPVSVHYYISKAGAIVQFVADNDTAWHAGVSSWVVDGKRVNGCNAVSVGIELENLNTGRDPYPQPQLDAALWLVRKLVAQYDVPREQLVRHLDISPGRKTDPAGFPWERFVADVYAGVTAPPLPDAVLRARLLELAFRAARGAAPGDWPLLNEAQARRCGMPVLAITRRASDSRSTGQPAAGAAQDDLARPLQIAGRALVLEAYARDLLYAPVGNLSQVGRLSEAPPGPLRDGLLQALFRAADPLGGFRPDWAFHQFYLDHALQLGVPLGPNHRIAGATSDGRTFVCQHFALDSLCAPTGAWRAIVRLSDLLRPGGNEQPSALRAAGLSPALARELGAMGLDDLYHSRTGRRFDPAATLCGYALAQGLGAPLADGVTETVGGRQLLMMPFALDVIYVEVGREQVGGLAMVLGHKRLIGSPVMGRLSGLLGSGGTGDPETVGLEDHETRRNAYRRDETHFAWSFELLGPVARRPWVADLAPHIIAGNIYPLKRVELVVLYAAPGPAMADLRAAAAPDRPAWHYYVDQGGGISRLIDERHAARVGPLDVRSYALAIGLEGAGEGLTSPQRAALAWLLSVLKERFGIEHRQIHTGPGWPETRPREPYASPESLLLGTI